MTDVILDLDFETVTKGIPIDKSDDGKQTLFRTHDAEERWYALHPLLKQ